MLRVVLDPGVLISALISPHGVPAELLRRWSSGQLQMVVSSQLLNEFSAVCARPRMRTWFTEDQARAVASLLSDGAQIFDDSDLGIPGPTDPKDAYLVALTMSSGADCLSSGDLGLLAYRSPVRIVSPRQLLDVLDELTLRE